MKNKKTRLIGAVLFAAVVAYVAVGPFITIHDPLKTVMQQAGAVR